jgi:hypothetical protein
LWQCRTLPDRPFTNHFAFANTGAGACTGSGTSPSTGSCSGTRAGTIAVAVERWRAAGDDLTEPCSVER